MGNQIVNDPGTRENTKTRLNQVLTPDLLVAEQGERTCSSISICEIEEESTLFTVNMYPFLPRCAVYGR